MSPRPEAPGPIEPPERMNANHRVLRVFFDHGHRWPLWETGTFKLAMEPQDYGFSPALATLLTRWFHAWEPIANYDIDQTDEVPTAAERDEEHSLALQAVVLIRLEVPGDVEVDATLIGL